MAGRPLKRDLPMRDLFGNRLGSCLLVLTVTLGLAACGGNSGSADSGGGTDSSSSSSGSTSGSGSTGGSSSGSTGGSGSTGSSSGSTSGSSSSGSSSGSTSGSSSSGSSSGSTGGSGSTSSSSGGSGSSTFTISGTLTGLATGSQVAIENNGADLTTLSANGTFSFATPVAFDGAYSVIVITQPQDATCTVQNGTGSGVTANVSNIVLQCSANTFTIGGTLTGLASGMEVTLDNNAADPLVLSANGSFTFSTPVAELGGYNVTVGSESAGQSCSVTNGQGTQVSANVSNITVGCSTDTYTIGGSVAGLAAGEQVTLEDNGGDSFTATANGSFTFVTPIVYGGAYTVTVGTEPTGQVCVVANGSGSAVAATVGNVNITCMANTVSFTTPGSYTWTVPAGITSVSIVATGGGGGGGGALVGDAGAPGGAGAIVSSTLTVTPGQTLNLVVGGGGGAGTSTPAPTPTPAWGGGAGGGSSNIDVGTDHQIIAGGGGGGGGAVFPAFDGGITNAAGGNAGGVGGAGGNGQIVAVGGANSVPAGYGGNGGTGGAGENITGTGPGLNGASGGNGNGGAGGAGGSDESGTTGGAGGSSVGAGTGGSYTQPYRSGGGGGGYGGGGSGAEEGGTGPESYTAEAGGGGAGGSTGPAGTTFTPASNGGGSATNGGNGSIVITLQ